MSESPAVNHFPELRKIVASEGLFNKAPIRSMIGLFLCCSWYIVCMWSLYYNQSVPFILFIAVILTLISAQLGFLMHDAGHRQVFTATWKNNLFGIIATFFNGASFHSWMQGHNEHHDHPNHEDLDPDIEMYFLSYSEKQVDETNPIMRYVAIHQAWLATFFYTFAFYMMRYASLHHVAKIHKMKIVLFDFFLSALWHIAYFGTLFVFLGFWKMLLFVIVHHALTGLHLALVFAPNHKGMPIFEKEENLNWFTRQIVTARNIYSNPVVNFLYGGLNFQIEHHLFPTMPRLHLRRAQQITKQFCREKKVDYYETSIVQSYKEVYGHLAEVGLYARNLKRPMDELQDQLSDLVLNLRTDLEALEKHDIHPDFTPITETLSSMASECLEKHNEKKIMRKEKLLLAHKEVKELSSAIRRHISPLRS